MNTLVGRYEITETLGGGGFAITYLARDIMQPSKPLCVVKQLRPNQFILITVNLNLCLRIIT